MFLSLFLLNFKGKARAQNTLKYLKHICFNPCLIFSSKRTWWRLLWSQMFSSLIISSAAQGHISVEKLKWLVTFTYCRKGKEGYGEYWETRGDYFPHPGLWNRVTITNCRHSDLENGTFRWTRCSASKTHPKKNRDVIDVCLWDKQFNIKLHRSLAFFVYG